MPESRNSQGQVIWERAFALAFGAWLAVALLKLGSPVILADKSSSPQDIIEVLFAIWPIEWGYGLLVPVVLLGLRVARWEMPRPMWLLLLPAAWFGWQMFAALQSVEPALTRATVAHFVACVVAFYLGLFALGPLREMRWFWGALLGGFTLVLLVGWHQHFIGLEETRRFFFQQPNWRDYPPEFLRKISSNRIYATLFYPNALAGVLLLLTPPWLCAVWQRSHRFVPATRWAISGAAALLPAACLMWSGSKAGWLIFVAVAMLGLWHTRLSPRTKGIVLVTVLALSLGGFAARYAGYFAKGATSVGARTDYWRAAAMLTSEHPWLGSGPGTFWIGYKRLKLPEAEMTRLAHNDYLQQACDSGVLGFLLYATFIVGSIICHYRKWRPTAMSRAFVVWLGVVALAAQGLVEFGLYIPALAWPFFALLGWLWGAQPEAASMPRAEPRPLEWRDPARTADRRRPV